MKRVSLPAFLREALHDPKLGSRAFRVLALLVEVHQVAKIEIGDRFTFSTADVAKCIGKTRETVYDILDEIELRGYACRQGVARTAPPVMVWRLQKVRENHG